MTWSAVARSVEDMSDSASIEGAGDCAPATIGNRQQTLEMTTRIAETTLRPILLPPARSREPNAANRVSARGLDRVHQLRRGLLAVAVQHAGVVQEEQGVLDAGEPGALAALDDDDVLGLVRVQDRHAIDG
jgi:hypothetical protein